MKRTESASAGVWCAALALTLGVEAQENPLPIPVFPFGAVYFRKSNPPEQDWERDHKTAAHSVHWNHLSVEAAPLKAGLVCHPPSPVP
jgi:hypothetical protein